MYTIKKDENGLPITIDFYGLPILHLQPSELTIENVEKVLEALNRTEIPLNYAENTLKRIAEYKREAWESLLFSYDECKRIAKYYFEEKKYISEWKSEKQQLHPDDIQEAINTIKVNYPSEKFTLLQEALNLAIKVLEEEKIKATFHQIK